MSQRRSLAGDAGGVSAVEFALVLPVLLVLFLGGYQLSDAIACNRKVTITARAVADLISQYSKMSAYQVDTVIGASTQVMYPYSASTAAIRVSQITTDALGNTKVSWSRASANATPLTKNGSFTLPANIKAPGTSLIYSEVSYPYTPRYTYGMVSPVTLAQTIYMVPRASNQVTASDF